MNTTLKDKITNVCGIILAMCAIVPLVSAQGIEVPGWLNTLAVTLGTIAGSVVAYFTGKAADGSPKKPV